MNGLLIVLWFVCGIAGVHIAQAMDLAKHDMQPVPADVWCAILGPLALLSSICGAISIATTKKDKT